MRFIVILGIAALPLMADPFSWNDTVFPYDSFRSLDESKMSVMVSPKVQYSISGGQTNTSIMAQDRTRFAVQHTGMTSSGWNNRLNASEQKKFEDYKDR